MPLTGLLPAWLRTPLLPIAIGKEWHAIAPFWLLSLVLASIVGIAPDRDVANLASVALFITNAALGASVIGHEFTHRTLGMLLTQPTTRNQLWRRKLGVAALALLTSTWPAGLALLTAPDHNGWDPLIVVAIPAASVLSGLCVAPWLTLATRSALAGTVFTGALPMLFALAGLCTSAILEALGALVTPSAATSIGVGLYVGLLISHWPAGACLAHRRFLRLEALEESAQGLVLPTRWYPRTAVTGSPATPGRWERCAIGKELRLQHISFWVAGLFAGMWGLLAIAKLLRPSLDLELLSNVAPIYAGFIALLAGALSCAEERQYGTLEWQLSLPVSAARQWVGKLGAVLMLALALGVVLPIVLRALTPLEDVRQGLLELPSRWFQVMIPMTLVLSCIGAYVSSVSRTTVHALLVSILVCLVVGLSLPNWMRAKAAFPPGPHAAAVASVFLGLVLALHGLANYRTVEQRFRRVAIHVTRVGLCAVATVAGCVAWEYALDHWGHDPTAIPGNAGIAAPAPSVIPGTNAPATNRPALDVNMMRRYGLIPQN